MLVPGITLICITRDQAGKLIRMLQSVQGSVDEIVVVDTGSKDLSVGVANMQGAKVVHTEWQDSFSIPLNLAIDQVQTEWILRLDTDEWLDAAAAIEIRRAATSQHDAYRLLRRDYCDERSFTEAWHLRLWRNQPKMRFQGRIHEHFDPQVMSKLGEADLPVIIHHDGFEGGTPVEKHRRNLHLLELELAERPGQLYYQIELATTLQLLGEKRAEAMIDEIADRLLSDPALLKETPITANVVAGALIQIPRRELNSDRANALAAMALEHFGDAPPMLWALANFEMRRLDRGRMREHLLSLKELRKTGDYRREWLFDPAILGHRLDAALADVET